MAGLLNIPEGFSSWDEYDQYMKATAPSMRKSYPGLITEFVATHPITKFLVPGAEQFLQKGGTPSAFDVGFGLLDTALPAVPVAGIAKKALKSRGKTREEVSIQGGMDWRYHDNGGVSAKEYYTENGRLKFKWKYFKDGTALRTIRNWLGY